jgi:hypothetical protein
MLFMAIFTIDECHIENMAIRDYLNLYFSNVATA